MSESKNPFDLSVETGDPFGEDFLNLGSAKGDGNPFAPSTEEDIVEGTPDSAADDDAGDGDTDVDTGDGDANASDDDDDDNDDDDEDDDDDEGDPYAASAPMPDAPPARAAAPAAASKSEKPQKATKAKTAAVKEVKPQKAAASEDEENDGDGGSDPLSSTIQKEQTQSIMAQKPIFDNGVREEIENTDQTFEELRQEKALHFSELQDASRVSWTVAYGVVKKPIYKPKEDKIGDVKREIERSKEFLKGLAKDRSPKCFVRPEVKAQKKGQLPAYMGVYTSIEEARTSGKPITLFPGGDGKVYERRDMEAGEFITAAGPTTDIPIVFPGFKPTLPPIPSSLLESVVAFFRAVMYRDKACTEALVNIYWDRKDKQYCIDVPPQKVSHEEVVSDLSGAPDPERYLHYMDIHSHNHMRAFFSDQDNADEQATRLYAVLGRLEDYYPQLVVRISNNGHFHRIAPDLVFESRAGDYLPDWLAQVTLQEGGMEAAA